jgi:hypothetical protein
MRGCEHGTGDTGAAPTDEDSSQLRTRRRNRNRSGAPVVAWQPGTDLTITNPSLTDGGIIEVRSSTARSKPWTPPARTPLT